MLITVIILAALVAALLIEKSRTVIFKGIVAVVRVFSPTAADSLAAKLGVASTDLDTLIADFTAKVKALEDHAIEMYDDAEEHAVAAADSARKSTIAKAVAAKATTIANNVKSLIAQ